MRRFTRGAIIALLGLAPFLASAVVTQEQNITITLPTDGSNYTLINSRVDSFTVNSSSIDFTMSGGQKVVLQSATKRGLGNSLNVNWTCYNDYSEVILELSQGASSQTVTVTPSSSCGAAGGGGGGGVGGGGSSGSSSSSSSSNSSSQAGTAEAPNVSNLESQVANLKQQLNTLQGSSVTGITITSDLARGREGAEVRVLQQMLAKDSAIYPEGIVNGVFGPKTQAAVRRFQAKHGLPQVGRVGPQTRTKLAEVFGNGASPSAASVTPASPVAPASLEAAITRALFVGTEGNDVTVLQQVLAKDPDVYPEGRVSGYFGPLTLEAVKRFQVKYGIAAEGDPGYGLVGPKTRAKLNELR
ncbi:MAG: peptidoglycan-binding protein [Candidatus Sungbacteria bacterium]|nr:peptidoglycan-binding protein [Candidatus Sungbacteria bacterium]